MIQANTPIAITMPAERWELVLRVMDEAPVCHRVVDPLMREIRQQCMAAVPTNGDATASSASDEG